MPKVSKFFITVIFYAIPSYAMALATCLGQICSIEPCQEATTYDNVYCVKERWRVYIPRYSINHYQQLMTSQDPIYFNNDANQPGNYSSSAHNSDSTNTQPDNSFNTGTR